LTNKENNIYTSLKDSPFKFTPSNISIKDDAFHDSTAPRFTEWWYFDAMFDNGYSIQLNVRFLSIIKNRFALIYKRTDIYKDGKLIKHYRKRYSLKDYDASKEIPCVKLDGKEVIKGFVDKKTGNLMYDLSFEIENTSANLRFKSCTKGWKGTNPGGDGWAVIIPRAEVNGKIKVNDEEIDVKGIGYHDHNWDVRYSATQNNHGWFWGKIYSNNFTITWATIYKNKEIGQPLLVINENNKGYINFKPEEIKFIGDKLSLKNKKMIPLHFILEANNGNEKLKFSMDVKDLHHDTNMIKNHYWRYHMICTGTITVGDKTETVKDVQIAEFLRFKNK
jgi:predicted secreted hydrolase